jgi:hypothetical protein
MSKSSPSADAPEPVLLIIADISGYTRYMTANAKTLAHSQTIITELVKAIIESVELPLEVAKLEGDAVFLFCRKQTGSNPWAEARRVIGEKLLRVFRLFGDKVVELSQSITCTCNACTHIEKLRLKVIVHSGEALFHHVFNFLELAGVDVIVLHRLLKNSIAADQYLLLTEAARQDLEFPEQIRWVNGSETFEEIGRINTLAFIPVADNKGDEIPSGQDDRQRATEGIPVSSLAARFSGSWKLYFKLWRAPFTAPTGTHQRNLRNIPSAKNATSRIAFALLTLLLAPIMLPVGTIFVLLHALKLPASPHCQFGHEHKPGCACER